MTSKAAWTILVYIAAHNDLDRAGQRTLAQLQQVGSRNGIQLAALLDGWSGASRYLIGAIPDELLTESLGRFDSGDPQMLLETAKWAFERHPAERYGLILWSHGTGYWNDRDFKQITAQVRGPSALTTPKDRAASTTSMALFRTTLEAILKVASPDERAILFDDGTQHSLDTLQLHSVVRELAQFVGQPLDLLGMDACLMGNLEVAYQVRNEVQCYVGSEELVPEQSWPYDAIVRRLQDRPHLTGVELGQTIVADYSAFYAAHPPGAGDVTKIALNLEGIDQVIQPLRTLATALQSNMLAHVHLLWQLQRDRFIVETRNERRVPNKFKYFLWDLAALADGLAISPDVQVREAAGAVARALRQGPALIAEAHQGDWFDGTGGLSIYMAPTAQDTPVSKAYAELALAQDIGWYDLLTLYKQQIQNL